MLTVTRWNIEQDGVMTLESVRNHIPHVSHYLVRLKSYQASARFEGGRTRAGVAYILRGEGRYSFGSETVYVRAGDIVQFPEGSVSLEVTSAEGLQEILFLELPESHWRQ